MGDRRLMHIRLLAGPAAAAILLAVAGCGNSSAADSKAKPAAAAQPAGGINDPVNFTLAAYGQYVNSPDKPSTDPIRYSEKPEFSPRLRSYFALDEKEAGGEVGRLDFDIYTGSQDGRIKDVEVEARDVDLANGQRKVMIVTFVNETTPMEMRLYFEKIGAKWYLDDIASIKDSRPDGSPPWTLSTILKYGW